MRSGGSALVALAATVALVAVAPSHVWASESSAEPPSRSDLALPLQANGVDPLNPAPWLFQYDTTGVDHIEAWLCHINGSTAGIQLTDVIEVLEGPTQDWYQQYSGGRLDLEVTAGGTLNASSVEECEEMIIAGTSGQAEVAVVLTDLDVGLGGLANARLAAGNYPENARFVLLDVVTVTEDLPTIAIHELGHTYWWEHINNGSDIMSPAHTEEFLATSAIYRYRAGWIDAEDVLVFGGGSTEVELSANLEAGPQMLVIPTNAAYRFVTIAPRVNHDTYDVLDWRPNGVEILLLDYRCNYDTGTCSLATDPTPVFGITAVGETVDLGNIDNYILAYSMDPPLELPVTLEVLSQVGNKVTIRLEGDVPELEYDVPGGGSGSAGTFVDDDGHTFEADIEWLAAEGITRGCNPPVNDRFCPDDFVTRGQMAAFLVRAFGYENDGGGDLFVDDNGSTFEADIDKLGTAEVTKGCNPPTNNQYCPDEFVTRGQMAAFLHRALGD